MKTKIPNPLKYLLLILLTFGLCFGLFYFVDNYLNGSFIDWFTDNYMITERVDGTFVQSLDLVAFKRLIFQVLGLGLLFLTVAIFLVAYTYSRKKTSAAIRQSSQLIQNYMAADSTDSEHFPDEYAAIIARLAEVKATIQRHEQVMKDETSRKNDLITYLAHDLKTPLTSVVGYLSLLDEAPDMPAAQKAKYVHITLAKAQRLEQLINEFFEITRYNLQKIEPEKETIDLYTMLLQLSDEFYPLLSPHGNTVSLVAAESQTVYGDSQELARVFNNILKNAISYSYPDTPIEIRATQTTRCVEIAFKNHGKTIPPQKLTALFDKFFRLDDSRATNTGGAGLGLAIAKDIVELHGGRIYVTSENETTTFVVELPLHS